MVAACGVTMVEDPDPGRGRGPAERADFAERGERPPAPDLPAYLRDPLERQPPDRLEAVAAYASALASWKRGEQNEAAQRRREAEVVDDAALDDLEARGVSTDPDDYDGVPDSGAYVTVKEPKDGYRYYYWQWREGDAWKNEYIGPVDPKGDS